MYTAGNRDGGMGKGIPKSYGAPKIESQVPEAGHGAAGLDTFPAGF